MDDAAILDRIQELAGLQRALRAEEEGQGPDEERVRRLRDLQVEEDRLYDLLRQRRALAGAGADPDDASERDAGTVEGYEQ